ncbi:hypothetical protein [Streptomyces violaceus]|uniref:Uncharacterized protein n=1 Tax=Streptomyces violaceus TaxID=1936 RepID=A0ABY9U127_STRVL|nr:hypothetical protein [Streptomyces janthinus]WND16070.1 hypothetical protein RI060_01285 [Streptomyces janthinus]
MPADLALNRSARQDARPSDLALRDRGDDTAVDPAGVANGGEAGVALAVAKMSAAISAALI